MINKKIKTIALSEIFLMVLSSIAFAFIVGGMGVMMTSEVNAASDGDTKIVNGVNYYYRGDSSLGEVGWYKISGTGSVLPGEKKVDDSSILTQLGEVKSPVINSVSVNYAQYVDPSNPTYNGKFFKEGEALPAGVDKNKITGYIFSNPSATDIYQTSTVQSSTLNVNQKPASIVSPAARAPAKTSSMTFTSQAPMNLGGTIVPAGTTLIKNGDGSISTLDPALSSSKMSAAEFSTATKDMVLNKKGSSILMDGKEYTFTEDVYAPKDMANSKVIEEAKKSNSITSPDSSINGAPPNSAGNTEINYGKEGGYNNPFSKNPIQSPVWGNLAEGVYYAGIVLTMTQLVAGFMPPGNSQNMVKAAGMAISAGIIAGKSTASLLSIGSTGTQNTWATQTRTVFGQEFTLRSGISIGVAVVAAYLTFAAQYKKEKTKTESIEFKCMTWQAPNGGVDCNKCNDNPLQPCSEYRCRSLGQTCKLINAGTGQDRCINSALSDTTSPGIKPWKEAITPGYAYSNVKERPAGDNAGISGMSITYNGGCLPAFTPFEYGIVTTDIGGVTQPAQCKIDFNHTTKFDQMSYYFGDDSLYAEEHAQAMSLPGTDLISTLYGSDGNESVLPIKNDGNYKLYVRCKDGNGNENRDEFVVSFCVDKSPDVTAPVIKAANPPASSPVLYQIDNASIQVYTNEPSECRWSRKDASYVNMENQMFCNNDVWEMNAEFLYTCNTVLTGIKDKQENKFFFRCTDRSAQNNTMQESYEYSLFGTQPLNILKVSPNGTISGSTSTVTTTLSVQTDNGYKNGEAKCSYSSNMDNGFIEMVNTGTNMHSQPLDLTEGSYTYYYRCIDAGGNIAQNSTNFTIFVDKFAPKVTRVYNFESKLTINTDEESTCKYSTVSCNFDVSKEGIVMPYDKNKVHFAEWKTTQSYYVKCLDEDGNQPNPTECSIVVRPYKTLQE